MAVIRYEDVAPELQGIVLREFFGTSLITTTVESSKIILTAENGRRGEIHYSVGDNNIWHYTGMTFIIPDPTNGSDVVIATVTGFDNVNPPSIFLNDLNDIDSIIGSNGNDRLESYGYDGSRPGDILDGKGGDDILVARHHETVLNGGSDNDVIRLEIQSSQAVAEVAVDGGDGFDTLEIVGGTVAFKSIGGAAALAGIERIVFSNEFMSWKTLRLQADQIAALPANLEVETRDPSRSMFEIVRNPGEAANIDLSGWAFTGWSEEQAPYMQVFRFDLDEDTPLNDTVHGSIFRDWIRTFGGDDFIDGGAGHDQLHGGHGADTVRGGDGDDTIIVLAGEAADGEIIDGGNGDDTLRFSGDLRGVSISNIERLVVDGADGAHLSNTLASNTVFEIAQPAVVHVYTDGKVLDASGWSAAYMDYGSRIEIIGASGADRIIAPTIRTVINGGDGLDIVRMDHTGKDTSVILDFSTPTNNRYVLGNGTILIDIERFELVGGKGRDILVGGAFGDTLVGGDGKDMLEGGDGDDFLDGGTATDLLDGGRGNDTYVVSKEDVVFDAGGLDTFLVTESFSLAAFASIENLSFQTASSTRSVNLTGNALANVIQGNAGKNTLKGGSGNDTLSGLAGNDILLGGAGKDTLSGGAGKDIFTFDTKLNKVSNVDILIDFRAADDTIRLDDAVFKGVKRGKLAKDAFVLGKKAADAQDRVIYNKKTGELYYDPDGTGSAKQVLFAKLANKASLSHLDFMIV